MKCSKMTEIYEMDENVEISEGLKWPKQQLWLIGFEEISLEWLIYQFFLTILTSLKGPAGWP